MLKAFFSERTRSLDVRIGILFSKIGISPNSWTALSLIPAVLGFISLYHHNLGLGLVFFIMSGFIDIIDGNVARVTKSVSNLGAFLDGVVDRYVEFSLYLGIWFYIDSQPAVLLPNGLWMMFLVFGAIMPSFITAYADHRSVVVDPQRLRRMGGLIERFERLLILYLGMLLGLFNPIWLTYTIILVALLSHLTAIQRIFWVIRGK